MFYNIEIFVPAVGRIFILNFCLKVGLGGNNLFKVLFVESQLADFVFGNFPALVLEL